MFPFEIIEAHKINATHTILMIATKKLLQDMKRVIYVINQARVFDGNTYVCAVLKK